MLIIGLTGGIGSGKSTVAALLAVHGATVIDIDALGREVIGPGGRAEAAVNAAFGPSILDPSGHIDRAALARVVFADPTALDRLTAISHPTINAELADRIGHLPADGIVVLDMAILVESRLGRLPDGGGYTRVITVEADTERRVERAVARGMGADDVRARMAAQASDAQRRAVTDVVVENDDDLIALGARVDEVWGEVLGWQQLSRRTV